MEPKAPYVFVPSSLRVLNKHTNERYRRIKWYLLLDGSHFHVYVVAQLSEKLLIRIDWNTNTTLTFEPYEAKSTDEAKLIGTTEAGFCKLCIEKKIHKYLEEYNLFRFNCRTVSFLILALVGFSAKWLYDYYVHKHILCGLDPSECFTIPELYHFLRYEEEKGNCTLF